uniref:Reverse transcriptase domain-containing protein n=1 Tax=Homalodisca liturata TaxID=320908 RepID=A0A1B6HS55_9HEMI
MSGKNTINAVENVVRKVLANFENKLLSSALLIDLSKAFDCINPEILKQKLFCYGIRDKELSLLISYLSDRKQMVVQREDKSVFRKVEMGVPQGSVLGPLLFIISVNYFPFNVPCPSILYADDTTLVNCNKDLDKLIIQEKHALDIAIEWFHSNSLIVNDQKTETIVFSLDHSIYKEYKPVKLLGIHIDSRLSWDCHMEQLCKKLSRVIFLFRKLRTCVTLNTLITAYYAFFHSQMRYGITLWGNSCGAQTVFKWQKKALRVIKNVSARESCVPLFKEYKIMTLPNLYIYCCVMDIKQSLNNLPTRRETHNYPTRQNYLLETIPVRLEKTKCSHVCMKIKLFNKLPKELWCLPLKQFEIKLKKFLKEIVFYSIVEYLAYDIDISV